MHGHSQKKNSFIYGCNTAADGGMISWTKVRLIPRIMAKQTPFFKLDECRFKVSEDKMSTARVVAWSELKITNSFTLETSFFGYSETQIDPTSYNSATAENASQSNTN